MPRQKRRWVSQNQGAFHIVSRTAGEDIWLYDEEKEYLMELLERFASGYFVAIHAFAILSSHFHILATGLNLDAKNAGKEELIKRYQLMYGDNAQIPPGSYQVDGSIVYDEDGGIERLRKRLGSVSMFVQDLKQTFSRWYNKKHKRRGFLWGGRFKGVIADKGEAQLICSAYIDLNPVRANIVDCPEDYRWSSLGLRVRNKKRAKELLNVLYEGDDSIIEELSGITPDGVDFKTIYSSHGLSWYREFVYLSGGIEKEGKSAIPQALVTNVVRCHGRLGIGNCLGYRVRNISEGLAIGGYSFITALQEKENRKFISPRRFLPGTKMFATRKLNI